MGKLLILMVEDMFKIYDSVVIGGGIFGCLCAIELSKLGKKIILLEQKDNLMDGASSNNTNRLHLGYHYPRDLNTALQCKKGFELFLNEYSNCILHNIDNFYCISSTGSKVNSKEYKQFCLNAGLKFDDITKEELPVKVNNVDLIINTKEVIYDCKELSKTIITKLKKQNIDFQTTSKVSRIKELDNRFKISIGKRDLYSKSIINSTYANYNLFHNDLELPKRIYQYELTIVPIIKWRSRKSPLGITLMDGAFFSVLPHGKSGNYTLYHVEYSVFDRIISENPPSEWDNPFDLIKKDNAKLIYEKMIENISNWLPSIKDSEYISYLSTVRMVLKNVEDTDARPSLMEKMPTKNCFLSLFSGKIDHSIWVSKEAATEVNKKIS
tara:strand:- start:1623 stop:2768 length:1146 start_codon:yes stop_codon:yes gene_type:complete